MAKVIVISGQGEKKNALEAVAAGAYDFLCKPIDPDELKLLLKRCIYLADLEREYQKAKESQRVTVFEDMLGTSPQMQGVFPLFARSQPQLRPYFYWAKVGRAKKWPLWGFTGVVRARTDHLSRLIAMRSPRTCLRANCSAMRKVRSPAQPCSE